MKSDPLLSEMTAPSRVDGLLRISYHNMTCDDNNLLEHSRVTSANMNSLDCVTSQLCEWSIASSGCGDAGDASERRKRSDEVFFSFELRFEAHESRLPRDGVQGATNATFYCVASSFI